jgi:hypothetical protein
VLGLTDSQTNCAEIGIRRDAAKKLAQLFKRIRLELGEQRIHGELALGFQEKAADYTVGSPPDVMMTPLRISLAGPAARFLFF